MGIYIFKSQLSTYPCPSNISFLYNYGYLSFNALCTCCFLFFFVIKHIIRDIYNGSLLRYLHSNGASFTFLVLYLHIYRSIIFQSYIFFISYLGYWYFLIFIFTYDSIFRIYITLG